MDSKDTLDFTLKIKADFLGVLAHPARLRLLEALRKGPKNVGMLAEETQLSQPAASKHLDILRQAGLLASQRTGNTVAYHVAIFSIFTVLRSLNEVLLEQLRQAERNLELLGRRL